MRQALLKYSALVLLLCCCYGAAAQNLINRNISLDVTGQRLDHVLEIISNKGSFYFSYNSNIIKRDSLVSLRVNNVSVGRVLQLLFGEGFEFRESGNYIIIRRAPIRLQLVTSSERSDDKFYVISGYVIDDQTGEKIADASVYEKNQLAVANTGANGHFRLRLKNKYEQAAISVSKEYYEDTTVIVRTRYNQTITVPLVPSEITETTILVGPAGFPAPDSIQLDVPIGDNFYWRYTYRKTDSAVVEKKGVGKWLVSSKQKLQSINLKKFFVARPYQVSVIPGISTNGKLNSQVVNNFSLNVFGGYAAGVNGLEIGGLFNIDKKDVQYVQAAGLFNTVGGALTGLQVGGISNTVLDSARGVQAGGVHNFTKDKFSGVQIGGVYNHTGASLDGVQAAGVANFVNHSTRGAQIAGVANISSREVRGAQIAGVFNYTNRLKGVQIGLINVSDTSEGYSIGLINIVFKGYHKLSLSTDEVLQANAAFKTGNEKLYNIFLGGYNFHPDEKAWAFGYGLGSELSISRRFSLNPELSSRYLYLGSWEYLNLLNRASLLLNFRIAKNIAVYAGPAYSVFVSDQQDKISGYKYPIPSTGHNKHAYSDRVTGWVGWTAGISLF